MTTPPPPSSAMPTLANCPLCGGPAEAHATSGSDERCGYNFVAVARCERCGCAISVGSKHDNNGWCNESPESAKARAIAAWNRRAPPPSATKGEGK